MDGRYRLDDSGPVHMRIPENWSPWSYAGDAAYLIAVHFQSGVENTHMCYEIQKTSMHGGNISLLEQPEAAAWYCEGSLPQVPSLHPSPSASPDPSPSAVVPTPQDKASGCNTSAEESLTDSVAPEKWVSDVEDWDMKDIGDTPILSVFKFDPAGEEVEGGGELRTPAMLARERAPTNETQGASLELTLECEAGMRRLIERGSTDAQVSRHFTMVDFNLSIAQVQQFRERSGMASSGK